MPKRPLFAASAAFLLAACSVSPVRDRPAPATIPAVDTPQVRSIEEAWVSTATPAEELDSLASWTTPDGGTWVIATGKSSHRLVVYDGDTGATMRTVGGEGTAAGQFARPNGIAVFGNAVFVVERDNHRVQVLSLPDFNPLGSFGDAVLRSPYGIWLDETEPGELQAYVTDSFMDGAQHDQVPPLADLDQRVRRFRVQFDQAGRVRASDAGAFGDTHPDTALRMVESIAGDAANVRLLIADESITHGSAGRASTLREYTFSGQYTGRSLPQDSFGAEAEGVALWTCPDGGGDWVAVDQLAPLTIFHLFDRLTLAPVGSFRGMRTAHTDGVALHAAATPRFPGGVLYAVHDDKAVAAFDLRDVADTLGLAAGCVR